MSAYWLQDRSSVTELAANYVRTHLRNLQDRFRIFMPLRTEPRMVYKPSTYSHRRITASLGSLRQKTGKTSARRTSGSFAIGMTYSPGFAPLALSQNIAVVSVGGQCQRCWWATNSRGKHTRELPLKGGGVNTNLDGIAFHCYRTHNPKNWAICCLCGGQNPCRPQAMVRTPQRNSRQITGP